MEKAQSGFSLDALPVFRRPLLALAVIVSLAFALRVGRCFLTDRIDKDGVLYVEMAKDWSEGGLEVAFDRNQRIPPLYIGVMAFGERCGIGAERTGRAVSVIAGALAVVAVFMIGRVVLRSASLALLGAFIAAVHPYLIRVSEDVLRDSLFICLELFMFAFAALGAASEGWRKQSVSWIACGAFAALGAMARSESFEIFPVLAVWGVWICISGRAELKRELGRVALAFAGSMAAFLIFAYPVEIMLKGSSSEWTALDKRAMVYAKNLKEQFFGVSEDVEGMR